MTDFEESNGCIDAPHTSATVVDADGNGMMSDELLMRLTRSVFTVARLPEGDEYVGVIGNGNELNNQAALHTLLQKHAVRLSELPESQRVEKSVEILLNRFADVAYLFNQSH